MKISILIPAYNSEKEIYTCIRSLLEQTYHDYEVIVVDDGSTDRTGSRLDFYAKNGFLPCNLPVRLCGVALDVLTPGGQALDFAAYQGFYRPIFGRLAPLFVQKRQ